MQKNVRTLATASGIALALTLTACGAPADEQEGAGNGSTAPPAAASADADSSAAHNDADTQFAQMMIVHHEGAIEMAELAAEKGASPEVRELGERIAGAQGPEIDLMTSWLQAWDEELPSETDMGGMDHGSMEMDGMDQEAVMSELTTLSGSDFDRRFLELMTDHHRGAIEMAEEHRAEGENAEAVQLSGKIIDDQTAEITEMTNLLADL
ncbi:DUF305 domain-containing protein [Actinotalea subterranea]|uniref:DUF305 domain-containing protein n=1 Tax=Actinotalea subterranea TaxID=2607497 RepID=UPI0011EE87A8|nr:DUF305 domain-containing protein [Actinotalea subterranea]